jgi:ariadne-1
VLLRDLEKAVEDLSELMESPIEPETIPTLRQKITDKTVCSLFPHLSLLHALMHPTKVYVQKRNEIMLEDTANGFRDGRWEWNVQID